jgi:flavin reductase (DIM6/NTAB) family NADH-FMN oxidoreductase RutF
VTSVEPELLELFRDAMARLAAGVAVVTCDEEDGRPRGLTATSVTAYSAEPPSVLVSVSQRSRSYGALVSRPRFAVHLLADGQEELAADFARPDDVKFERHAWHRAADGVPVLEGAMAVLHCANERVFEHGDHAVVIGRVEHIELTELAPLVYFERGFRRFATHPLEADADRGDL